MANHQRTATLAPMLYLQDVAAGMEYYARAFGAIALRHFSNEDGSVHVAEMSIGNALFRLHEEVPRAGEFSPTTLNGSTAVIGLLVEDPDTVQANAIAAGAVEIHPVQDYEYGLGRAPLPIHSAITGRLKKLLW